MCIVAPSRAELSKQYGPCSMARAWLIACGFCFGGEGVESGAEFGGGGVVDFGVEVEVDFGCPEEVFKL